MPKHARSFVASLLCWSSSFLVGAALSLVSSAHGASRSSARIEKESSLSPRAALASLSAEIELIELRAQRGRLDLAGQEISGHMELGGYWDFYWDWRWPSGVVSIPSRWPLTEERVDIGRSWTGFIDVQSGQPRPLYGRALYRLQITGLRPRKGGYILRLPEGSSRLWLYAEGTGQDLMKAALREDAEGVEWVLRFAPEDLLSSWVLLIERSVASSAAAAAIQWRAPVLEAAAPLR